MPGGLVGTGTGEAARRDGQTLVGDPVREAAVTFASLLLKELLKTSFSAEATPGLFPRGAEGELYRDVFLDTVAREVAAAGSFPLTAQLAAYMGAGGKAVPAQSAIYVPPAGQTPMREG